VTGIVLAVVLIAAVASVTARRWRRARLRKAARARPGTSAERAIHIRSYSEIDEHVRRRWCICGGYLEQAGEGTRETGGRRFRVVRLRCQECDEVDEVFFETTDALH